MNIVKTIIYHYFIIPNKPSSSHGEYAETLSFQFSYDIVRCDLVPNPKKHEGKHTDPLHFPGMK